LWPPNRVRCSKSMLNAALGDSSLIFAWFK
jgi:hypothetical protein